MSTKYTVVGSSKEVVLPDKDTIVKITVEKQEKAKNRKCTSTVITSRATGQKATAEKKKSMASNSKTPQNWGLVFGKQNLSHMKEAQSSRSIKQTQNKEAKKNSHVEEQRRNEHSHGNKHMDATSPKKVFSQKKSEEHSKTLCCGKPLSSSMNSIPSVLVQDRSVQCSEIYDNSNRLGESNLMCTLCSLVKELGLGKKDKRTNEIFTEIEQILSKIPGNSRKSISEALEFIVARFKLEESTAELKESNKKMKAMYKSWASKRETLQSQIQKQDECLKEAKQKLVDLEDHEKMLMQQLEEATQAVEAKDKIISALRQQIENHQSSGKIISDLRAELAEQTELARSRHKEILYLQMEKDKISVLASYKDTHITECRNIISKLQNDVKQLTILSEVYVNEGNASPQISAVHTGPACSSPNSRSSDRSNDLVFCNNLSDISLSTVEHAQDIAIRDSAHFISLPGGESSHTIMPDSHKNEVTNDEETVTQYYNENNTAPYGNVNANHAIANKPLHYLSKKDHNKENDIFKAKKLSIPKESLNDNTKSPFRHKPSKILGSVASHKPIISDIEKQVQDMLDIQNRIPVNVPSPLRDYPHPDWSDSSLPSVTTASDLDIVPSNDI